MATIEPMGRVVFKSVTAPAKRGALAVAAYSNGPSVIVMKSYSSKVM
jgi:hypothetical protein